MFVERGLDPGQSAIEFGTKEVKDLHDARQAKHAPGSLRARASAVSEVLENKTRNKMYPHKKTK